MITFRKFNDGYLTTHLYAHLYTDISNRVRDKVSSNNEKIGHNKVKLRDSLDFPGFTVKTSLIVSWIVLNTV